MADLRLADGFQEFLRARLEHPEGQAAIERLVGVIAQSAIEAMPHDLLASLSGAEGKRVLEELWPDIVDAYFRALSNSR